MIISIEKNQKKSQLENYALEKRKGTNLVRHLGLVLAVSIGILFSGSSVFAQAMWSDTDGLILNTNINNIGVIPNNISNFKNIIDTKKDSYGRDILSHYSAVGCAVVAFEINQNGTISSYPVYKGFRNKKEGYLVDQYTVFQAASISKPVSAWGLLKMAETDWCKNIYSDTKTFLDNPITDYLELDNKWSLPAVEGKDISEVTLRQILHHTSGISLSNNPKEVIGYTGWDGTESYLDKFSNDYNCELIPGSNGKKRLPSLIAELNGNPENNGVLKKNTLPATLYFTPGQQAVYSGAGYEVMQKVMEIVLREYLYTNNAVGTIGYVPDYMLFNKFMYENLLMGFMTQSTFYNYDTANLAQPYFSNVLKLYKNLYYTTKSAAGLYTTAGDLSIFVKALIDDLNNNNGVKVNTIINPAVVLYNGNFCILSKGTSIGFVGKYIGDMNNNSNLYTFEGKPIAKVNILAPSQINILKNKGYIMKKLDCFWGHSGSNSGYRSLIMFHGATSKSKGFGLVVLTNSDQGASVMQDIASAWVAMYINNNQ